MKSVLHNNHRRLKGFTLTELLVVLVISMIGVAGMLLMFSQSAQSVNLLDQHLGMQRQLRFATESIKRDLRLAGFLATPNSWVDNNLCPKPISNQDVLRAVSIQRDDGYVHLPAYNVKIEPSSLTLFGDFSGGTLFRTTDINISSGIVTLQESPNLPANEQDWDIIFQEHRSLRVTNPEQFEFYLPIQRSEFASRSIKLSGLIPEANPPNNCGVLGFGAGYEVNLTYHIRYRIIQDPRGRSKTVLVREELDDLGISVESTRMIIGENIVDLQFYDFAFDQDSTGTNPNLAWVPKVSDILDGTMVAEPAGGGLLGDSMLNARPQDLRALTIKVTSCVREQDSALTFVPRTDPDAPIYAFKIDTVMKGSGRCMSAASRIHLRSLMVRNLKAGVL